VHVNLHGTKADAIIVGEISLFFDRETISNLIGKMALFELANMFPCSPADI
jgi:hypothetical protein